MDPLVTAYLGRLGVADPGPPSAEALRRLHVAHVERIPYETVGIALGRPVGIQPQESVPRIVTGWGGYCYHLNGAFAWLLARLGYAVSHHVGGVQTPGRPAPGPNGNHLALTVTLPEQTWLVDVGLGLGLHEPLPLAAGTHAAGAFTLGLARSELTQGWRLEQDRRIDVFEGMDFADAPAGIADFQDKHVRLSTDPRSGFVAWVNVQRRTAQAAWALKNLVLTRYAGEGVTRRELDTPQLLWQTLEELFHFTPSDLSDAEREALWQRLWDAHRRWRDSVVTPR